MKQVAALLLLVLATPVAAQTPGASNPLKGDAKAVEDGRVLYNQGCTACHGANGTAGEFAPALGQSGRRYNRNTDAEIFDAVKNGIPGTAMPARGGRMSDTEIWKVVAYVQGLRGTAIDAPSPGDVAHGEAVFWGKGQCGSCHMINGRGSVIGPELANLAGIRKTNAIIDALTKPDHRVYGDGGAIPHTLKPLATYQSVRITTRDGKTLDGILRNEDSYAVQVMGMDGQLHLFDRAKVAKLDYLPGSIMPTDYDKRLTKEEFADLLAFLTRQAAGRAPTGGQSKLGDPD